MMMKSLTWLVAIALAAAGSVSAQTVLVEAESFNDQGGWQLDTQFIEIMGSPYLIAHGLGQPVKDAVTKVKFPAAGSYRVWVRTKDWVAPWQAPGTPGRFQLAVAGKTLEKEFGTEGAEWHWQEGGSVEVVEGETEIRLHDLTGFAGRCDAIVFSRDPAFTPDNSSAVLPAWRRTLLGIPEAPVEAGTYDIVFVGGGYAGACGAISAARMGLKVALIQNREVLGGNGSSEVRVWAMGNTPPGLYPVGDIVREFEDDAKSSPGTFEEFEDAKKEGVVRGEKNIDLFFGHHAFAVEMKENKVDAVLALDTRTSAVRRFHGTFFCDATGHGYIGMLAGADRTQIEKGRMGMSNMWRWENTEQPQTFPDTPWALNLDEKGFPYPKKFHAEWFWESGYDKDPLKDLELIRDWNLRANFGAWNAIKNKGAYGRYDESKNEHKNARLTWMAYIGGTRETQQLLGDVILTEQDILDKKPFDDGCVLTTWSVDLHYPQEQYIGEFKDNPFISRAHHGGAVDRKKGYPIPYRCFYSRNIENLFMAGRNISVTHEALGTIRVMKTCGMMGVVVGKAAAVAKKNNCTPRYVYQSYLPELIELLKLPGNMRRADLASPFFEDPKLPKLEEMTFASMSGGIEPKSLPGIVIDDTAAKLTGNWTSGTGLKGFVGEHYLYRGADPNGQARFEFTVQEAGKYEIRTAWQPHENRATNALVKVEIGGEVKKEERVNQQKPAPLDKGFASLGVFELTAGQSGAVILSTAGADGAVHADAVQVIKAP